ncbi:MAG: rRNA maturation RNase YbeY [Holosporaceae bacterium]|jgi:probable rRNA maturation factor|nr:rRNA maturation RNase YbeY [Holosporaceae bacterium]
MNLEISVEGDFWQEKEAESVASECARAVFAEVGFKEDNIEVCFLFTTDDEIRVLNKTYRGADKPTNVLSFPADFLAESDNEEEDEGFPRILGSIAVAFETVKRESEEQKKSFIDHLRHLVVHGMLHLLRYDHAKDEEAELMEALEVKILERLGVGNPYLQEVL